MSEMPYFHSASKMLTYFSYQKPILRCIFFQRKKNCEIAKDKRKKYWHLFTEDEIVKISKKRGLMNHMNAEISAEVPCWCWSDGCNCWELLISVKLAAKWMSLKKRTFGHLLGIFFAWSTTEVINSDKLWPLYGKMEVLWWIWWLNKL